MCQSLLFNKVAGLRQNTFGHQLLNFLMLLQDHGRNETNSGENNIYVMKNRWIKKSRLSQQVPSTI